MAWDRKVPFNKETGDMLNYVESWDRNHDNIEWCDADTCFSARLRFADYHRGRSAASFLLEDIETGKLYYLAMCDAISVIARVCGGSVREPRNSGTVFGSWKFCKRGQNYFITPA